MCMIAIKLRYTKHLNFLMIWIGETPFPCNGNWDKKAWIWLKENGCKLNGDILFYNLGGECASLWRQ